MVGEEEKRKGRSRRRKENIFSYRHNLKPINYNQMGQTELTRSIQSLVWNFKIEPNQTETKRTGVELRGGEGSSSLGDKNKVKSPTMSETEATGVTDEFAPENATAADATEHTSIGVVDSVEEAIGGGAEKWVDGFQRTVKESTDSAIRSARSLRENSTSQFRSIQVYHLSSRFFNNDSLQIR